MADVSLHEPYSRIIAMTGRTMLWVALIGAATGLLFWGGAQVIERAVLEPIFCGTGNSGICTNKASIASSAALVVAVFVAIVGLIRANVYRPLLISLAVAAALWGVGGLVAGLAWYYALLWSVLLFTFAYLLFAWVSRLRNFSLALVVTVVLVIGLRLAAYL